MLKCLSCNKPAEPGSNYCKDCGGGKIKIGTGYERVPRSPKEQP